jgi:hypothetical protein
VSETAQQKWNGMRMIQREKLLAASDLVRAAAYDWWELYEAERREIERLLAKKETKS